MKLTTLLHPFVEKICSQSATFKFLAAIITADRLAFSYNINLMASRHKTKH